MPDPAHLDPSILPASDQANFLESDESRATESHEFELTPEIEGRIMEKVQDIHREGIGFSIVEGEKTFDNIFKNGLVPTFGEPFENSIDQRKDYAWLMRKDKSSHRGVWFNITGRVNDIADHSSEYYNRYYSGPVVLFSLDGFQELNSGLLEEQLEKKLKTTQFGYAKEEELRGYPTGYKVGSEYGFKLNGRISPKHFTGLISSSARDMLAYYRILKNEQPSDEAKKEIEDEIRRYLNILDKKFISAMRTSGCYVPIYDYNGNLAWPKQMSYKEVRQYVAEREAQEQVTSSAMDDQEIVS